MYELTKRPNLEDPVLLVGLEGWIDAGFGGVSAVSAVFDQADTELIGQFDSDALLDYRSRRPTEHIVSGVNSEISWPEIVIRAGQDKNGKDLLIIAGPEPDMAWKKFSAAIAELALDFDVRLSASMGAFPAPVPHTRPVRLATSTTNPKIAEENEFINTTVDVPAGIHGVVENVLAENGVDAVGIWARVPHYVAGMPYPAASAALLESFCRLTGLEFDVAELNESAKVTRDRIDALISNSDEHTALVRQLEEQVDAEDAANEGWGGEIPSGDEIAAELERFLRGEPS